MPPRNVSGMPVETPAGRNPNGRITSNDSQRASAERRCFEGGTCSAEAAPGAACSESATAVFLSGAARLQARLILSTVNLTRCIVFAAMAVCSAAATASADPFVYVLGRTLGTPRVNVLT